jgi:endonuclease-3
MEIASQDARRYVADYFDSFYVARALNRDPEAIAKLRMPGKKLYLLANSGCLRECSAHVFHDNLVAHETESDPMDCAWQFRGICWEYYGKPANRQRILADSTWVRPEEIDRYTGLVDGIKDPKRVEMALWKIIPAEEGNDFCHRLVYHGRDVCTARTKPYCSRCCLADICAKAGLEETQ